ncbi:MAG: AbrB/MazE/SpoVT family DNA-binding domain-containing protein [Betaproteobacteria bacterium]|nr:AbrB/MazE/SpoVT family DNA-binding domain-containing protein [Betaproteobacteria bacterium]
METMETIKTSSKGQIVIPKTIRQALDIQSGTELKVELLPGEGFKVTVSHAGRMGKVKALSGMLARHVAEEAPALDDRSLLGAVLQDDARTRSYGKAKGRKRR